jgi:hypothetical protein
MVGVKPPGGMTMAGRGPIDGGFIESGKSLVTDDDQGNPSEVKCLELTAGLFNRESNKLQPIASATAYRLLRNGLILLIQTDLV